MTKENMGKMAIALFLPLMVGLCQTAEEVQAKGAEVSSRGAIVYQDDGEKAKIYAADILILKEKLDTIPDEIYSPSHYARVHQWEDKECGQQWVEEAYDFTLEMQDEETEPDESVQYCEYGDNWQTEEVEVTEPETDELEMPEEKREDSVSENSISENTIITEEEVGDTI